MAGYDVIVVGGGPAGASAARRSAQLGMKTLLLDQAFFPREKLCGGAVSHYGLSSLDFDLPQDMIERTIYGARLHYGDIVTEVRKPHRLAVLVRRAEFDHLLFQKALQAGAEGIQGEKITAVSVERDGVSVTAASRQTYHGKVVIGCDGCHSVTARAVPGIPNRAPLGICLEVFIPADEEATRHYLNDCIGIYMDVMPGGYGWVFPRRQSLAVGVGGWAGRVDDIRQVLASFLTRLGLTYDGKFKGHAIPLTGLHRRIHAGRLLLAGDAAGTVDPFNGEGIAYSIRSGQIAAETAAEAVRKGNLSAGELQAYAHRCRREFGRSLHWSSYFMRLVHRYPRRLLKTLVADRRAIDRYLDIPLRKRSYESFLLWLIPRLLGQIVRRYLG